MPVYLKRAKGAVPQAGSPTFGVSTIVKDVISNFRTKGDSAVAEYSQNFDKWTPPSLKLTKEQIQSIIAEVPKQTIKDIKEVQSNLEIQPGVFLGQKNIPINRVGAYIPGGRYPLLASDHMTILTAKVPGVPHVIACTPPIAGEIPKATVAAMYFAGTDEIYILGGVQAIAAMACGTETISKVDFLAGPGNAFVAEGKRQLFGEVGINLFAGPTEILIIADEHADPYTCAVDLLSQAEHGPDTPAVLITNSERVGKEMIAWVTHLLKILPTAYQEFRNPEASGNLGRLYGRASRAENFEGHARSGDLRAAKHLKDEIPWIVESQGNRTFTTKT